MLAWLAAWLKQIIAVVLLAGLIDLLLPNKSMQRYVRLVAGLIILLTILTPIIRLLQGDFDTKLKASIDPWLNGTAGKEYKMPTLEEISRNADKMRQQQERAAAALTENQLAAQMKEELIKQTGMQVDRLAVRLEQARAGSELVIREVQIALAKPRNAEGHDSPEKESAQTDIEIEPVQPVIISIQAEEEGAAQEQQPPSEIDRQLAEQITTILQRGWSVAPHMVSIHWSSG
ncbi:stage III sporulation protein AF [Paenibacillus sp. GCM10027626]|uniref:stage III sporulation protein AF n=1 Tax=Paenibacillus sp. GCM10027626 TaxID=3273411 RepID=UPI003637D264